MTIILETLQQSHPNLQGSGYLQMISNSEGHLQTLHIPTDQMIFNVAPIYDDKGNQVSLSLSLKPELSSFLPTGRII
ncbi:hypothetical protein DYY67_2260 [Candidatus Nitrosotalea sp. TS]|nr:hypothetical protein [Candidatus Nitrosotalea sp. TS]